MSCGIGRKSYNPPNSKHFWVRHPPWLLVSVNLHPCPKLSLSHELNDIPSVPMLGMENPHPKILLDPLNHIKSGKFHGKILCLLDPMGNSPSKRPLLNGTDRPQDQRSSQRSLRSSGRWRKHLGKTNTQLVQGGQLGCLLYGLLTGNGITYILSYCMTLLILYSLI